MLFQVVLCALPARRSNSSRVLQSPRDINWNYVVRKTVILMLWYLFPSRPWEAMEINCERTQLHTLRLSGSLVRACPRAKVLRSGLLRILVCCGAKLLPTRWRPGNPNANKAPYLRTCTVQIFRSSPYSKTSRAKPRSEHSNHSLCADNRISGEVKWDYDAVEELVIEGPTVGHRLMDLVSISGPKLVEKILFGETSSWCIGYTREICEVSCETHLGFSCSVESRRVSFLLPFRADVPCGGSLVL